VGWERASSFGFSALGFSVGKKPNVLDRAAGFFTLTHNNCITPIHIDTIVVISFMCAMYYFLIRCPKD
jgi:hypothetical protein